MENFKELAKKHQIKFKTDILKISESGYFEKKIVHPKTKEVIDEKRRIPSPTFLPENDWKNGFNYVEEFRSEIKEELNGFNNKMRDANMLRSEHIPLNIFVPMRNNSILTRQLFNTLLGNDCIETITGIHLEMAGGISKADYDRKKYLDDGTSFDTRIDFIHKNGGNGYIGIEVKYTEEGYRIGKKENEDILKSENNLYVQVSQLSGFFNDYDIETLVKHKIRKNDDIRQIWRNHILGASMVHRTKEINHFYHIHLYPQGNNHFEKKALLEYKKLLTEKGNETFIPITYEIFFSKLKSIFTDNETQKNWVKYLKERYLFD